MDRDWKSLGRAVRSARKRLGLSQDELAEAAGVSRATLQVIEQGRGFNDLPKSVLKVVAVFDWPAGGLESILAGRDLPAVDAPGSHAAAPPEAASADEPAAGRGFADGMTRRAMNELSEGEVLDDLVLELAAAGPNTKLVIVLKRDGADDGTDPEEIKRDLREWARVQRELIRAASEDQDPSGRSAD